MQNLYKIVKEQLLNGLLAKIEQVHHQSISLSSFTEEVAEDRIVCHYDLQNALHLCDITVRGCADVLIFRIDAKLVSTYRGAFNFAAENAFNLSLGTMVPDALLGSEHSGPWWMYPTFTNDFSKLNRRTQNLLVRHGDTHYHLLPLCGENFRCELDGDGLHLVSDTSGLFELHGDFLAVSVGKDPTALLNRTAAYAKEQGAIRIPLREERELPEMFRHFGWCSWNAFYHDVTAEKLYTKLDEFREKNVPVEWIIIDDGWSFIRERMLAGFDADRTKFPDGLKACIDRIKGEYGVKYVGVWHTFNGYWDGIDPESPLYALYGDLLFTAPSGMVIPALDEEKAFRFWDLWHSHLAACGVDFLKIDNQSSFTGNILGAMPTAEACRIAHAAIERSVFKNFGGSVINCMGMDVENVLARPRSAVSRNSDDFYPGARRGFTQHLVQNIYNALWHNAYYYCDYDMWWSCHDSAKQSGVLRAISGSPIYTSDAVNGTSMENILPVVENDGTVMLCDYAARPTTECIYSNCVEEKHLLNVWNRSGDAFALAAFNVCENSIDGIVDFGGIPELVADRTYIAYEYFTKTYIRVTKKTLLHVTVEGDCQRVWSIYPIEIENGVEYILCGDTSKYVPIAAAVKTKVAVADIL